MASEPEPSSNGSDPVAVASGRRLRRSWWWLLWLAPALSVGAASCSLGPEPVPPGPASVPVDPATRDLASATVDRVIDGDTVDLVIGGQRERVRLVGIDAPESVSPTVPDQCFGAEASQALHDLLPVGTEVRIERDVEARDRYGRLLLYLHRSGDDLFVNQWLVASGLADAVVYEPNSAFRIPLAEARRQAQQSGTGLWGRCDGPDQPLG